MNKLFISIILAVALTVSGCGGTFSIHNKETVEQMSPIQKAEAGIKEVKAAMTVINRNAVLDRKAGVYNDVEWVNFKEKVNEIDKYIKEAEKYIALGDLTSAENRKDLIDKSFAYLKAELVKRKE